MKRSCLILFWVFSACLCGEEVSFQPPQAYSLQRYEADWSRNPFTLPTAPAVLSADSFAKDLAVATYFGDVANPTIVVVNTKTNERTSLQKGRASGNGWQLGVVNLGSSRKDISVELIHRGERAWLKFDDGYVRALAASAPSGGRSAEPATGGVRKLTLPLPVASPANTTPAAPSPAAPVSGSTAVILPPLPEAVAITPASPLRRSSLTLPRAPQRPAPVPAPAKPSS